MALPTPTPCCEETLTMQYYPIQTNTALEEYTLTVDSVGYLWQQQWDEDT